MRSVVVLPTPRWPEERGERGAAEFETRRRPRRGLSEAFRDVVELQMDAALRRGGGRITHVLLQREPATRQDCHDRQGGDGHRDVSHRERSRATPVEIVHQLEDADRRDVEPWLNKKMTIESVVTARTNVVTKPTRKDRRAFGRSTSRNRVARRTKACRGLVHRLVDLPQARPR